jgi:hypothetical protein
VPIGCKITLDETELEGVTPIEGVAIAPDKPHRVVALCPKYEEEVKTVFGRAGQTIRLGFAPSPREGADTPAYGFLRLDTEPWSVIYLGKRKLGVTPIMRAKLRPGKHRLTAVNQDKGIKKTIVVKIRPGKTTKMVKKLDE